MSDRGAPSTPSAGSAAGGSRNRRWLVIIGVTPLLVLIVAAVIYVAGPTEPSVSLTPPAGYQTISNVYFAYAIPSAWKADGSGTDSNGDSYYRGPGGWVGETLRQRDTPPALGEPAPPTLASFAQPRATPYRLTSGAAVSVPGTDAAWSYRLLRPGARPVRVLDAWGRASRTEIWLVVSAEDLQASTIVGSLRA